MTEPRWRTISNRMVAALEVERDTVFWDRELSGFGVRAYPGGGKVYVVQARGPEGPKRVTVGRHGVVNAEEARRRAALVIARVKAGEEPVPEPLALRLASGPSVADLAARYILRRGAGGTAHDRPFRAQGWRTVRDPQMTDYAKRVSMGDLRRRLFGDRVSCSRIDRLPAGRSKCLEIVR